MMAQSKMVALVLSNPLTAEQATRLRAVDERDYRPGDKIKVPESEAQAIIAAGYAHKVEPSDPEAVAKALNVSVEQAKASSEASRPSKS